MIFGRRGGSGRHARAGENRRSGPRHAAGRREDDGDFGDEYGDRDAGRFRAAAGGGPYDVADAPEGVTRLDLGSLHIPAVEGVEVRVQANPDGAIQQVVLVNGPNALQLGVFAAPRTEGIWDEVREEIRDQLSDDGVAAEQIEGEYGIELRARVRTSETLTDLRFVGVDGPRWMVRGVFQGPAAVDPTLAGPLAVCLRELVVDRGQEAKPAREPLPLRLPRDVAGRTPGQPVAGDGAAGRPQAGSGPFTGGVPGAPPVATGQAPFNGAAPATGTPATGTPAAGTPAARRRPSPRPRQGPGPG